MSTTKSYSEKLRDPRWQKRRLEILNKNGFACEQCGDSESTLHVHHFLYRSRTEPWDYPDEELKCLCERCHEDEEEAKTLMLELMARIPPHSPIWNIAMALQTMIARGDEWEVFRWCMCAEHPDLIDEAARRHMESIRANTKETTP